MTEHTQRVNYDLIAHLYDEPSRNYDVDSNLIEFLEQKSILQPRILDLGCGTGKQLTANYNKFPELHLVGLDLFRGMLCQAYKRCPNINWIQGDSTYPPFADHFFDYITNQFSYHHVSNKIRMFAEICRILKPGGRFVITNLDPWSMAGWIVYQFFPASRQRDLTDFLPISVLISQLKRAGFFNVQVKRVHTRGEENLGAFLGYASQRFRTSQLIAIQDDEYEDGIARLKAEIIKFGKDRQVPSEICLIYMTADKP